MSPTIDRLAGCALGVILLLSAGCQGPSAAPQGPGLITVVTTTTVFADMVRNVAPGAQVTSLVPKNGDVHTYSAKPSDIQAVANARLLVMNGLGLDDWMTRTIANASSASGTLLVKLGEGLPGVALLPGEEPGTQNPHLWMNVGYAELYVDRIAAALEKVDPPHAADYQRNAAAYRQRLAGLDAQVRAQVATIPIANRRLVTFHDAFPYYARAYGITIVGVAVEAPGQDPSAGYTARLIDAIKAARVKAIFSEAQFPPRLVDQLGAATGAKVVANLYDDALGDPPVTSYEAVITWDTAQLVQALR